VAIELIPAKECLAKECLWLAAEQEPEIGEESLVNKKSWSL